MSDRIVADRYRLIEEVGSGGMGVVWRAEDTLLHRDVAVKLLNLRNIPEADRATTQRLLREARLAARLKNRHAAIVHDVSVKDEAAFIVMEYVPGVTLAVRLREQNRLEPEVAANVVTQVADALAAAHDLGIVHRDVKPANIIINDADEAKLVDFGIAKTSDDTAITSAGDFIGTLAFMAPEIARGESATAASDVWSLGATFFAAVEGHAPFLASTEGATPTALLRVLGDPPPMPTNAGRFAPVVSAMLNSDPSARPSAREVLRQLQALAAGAEGDAAGLSVHQTRRWVRRSAVTVAALVGIATAGTATLVFVHREGARSHPASGTATRSSATATRSSATATATAPSKRPTQAPLLPPGTIAARGQIPWASVTDGWILASTGQATQDNFHTTGDTSLYLLNPIGGIYLVASLSGGGRVADWSVKRHVALLVGSPQGDRIVDLFTGVAETLTSVGVEADRIQFADTDGITYLGGSQGSSLHLSADGGERPYPSSDVTIGNLYFPVVVVSPTGDIAMSGSHGIAIVGETGKVQQTFRAPTGLANCQALKMIAPATLLTSCTTPQAAVSAVTDAHYVKFPLNGSTPTLLPVPNAVASDPAMQPWSIGSESVFAHVNCIAPADSGNGLYLLDSERSTREVITGLASALTPDRLVTQHESTVVGLFNRCPTAQFVDSLESVNIATRTATTLIVGTSSASVLSAVAYPGLVPPS